MPVRYVSDPPSTADVVVIGGGIVGAATAFHASAAGLRTVLVERRPALCTLTTAAAAGGFRLQLDTEEEFLVVRGSVELFHAFAERTGQAVYDPKVREQGYLWVTTSEDAVEGQRRLAETQASWGVDGIEVLDREEVVRRFPFITPEVVQARYRAGDGLVDPKAVTFGLAAASGADVVVRCGVTGFRIEGDAVVGVETERGTISTRNAVIACGPLSGRLAERVGIDLPIHTVRRHKLVLPEVPEVPQDAPMTIDEDTGAHWRPAFRGAFALFTDPTTPASPPEEVVTPDPSFAFSVLDPRSPAALARIAPFWHSVWERGSDHWVLQAGQYTMTPDRRPLIGQTALPGLWVNTGYSGHGVMMSPAASSLVVDGIVGRDRTNAFRPDREFAVPHTGVL
ncbi:MAG TPA: FAD-dependent oxidoreductase [Actinomycetota bacterium]|nr:FAD-dependent oxidoreductase [Actinomycetota bacterium]